MFEKGDFAVYPGHGVGAIEGIESMEMGGKVQDFYVLSILDTKMTIMVPKENAHTAGMREVIDPEKIPEVYEILKCAKAPNNHQPWNQRYRGYMERIIGQKDVRRLGRSSCRRIRVHLPRSRTSGR